MSQNPNIKLFNAVLNNDQSLFNSLISNKNIDFNYQIKNNPEWMGCTLLILAVTFNRLKMVQELLVKHVINLKIVKVILLAQHQVQLVVVGNVRTKRRYSILLQ